jgi:hypothetical protein
MQDYMCHVMQVDVDPAEMYAQMQDLENKHRTQLEKLQKENQFQIEELEAELEDLRNAAPKCVALSACFGVLETTFILC